MTTPNSQFVPAFNIQTIILDKTNGEPLADGTVEFFIDTQRVTPKPVYQLTGDPFNYQFQNIGNKLTLAIDGSFVDGSGNPIVPYFFPFDAEGNEERYYIVVKDSGGTEQFTREAVPQTNVGGGGTGPSAGGTSNVNELINPQFTDVLFNENRPFTLTVTGTNTETPLAPGWSLITSGTGDVTIERINNIPQGAPTRPPYALKINASSNIGSTVRIRQRLVESPKIFGNDFVSGSITARVSDSSTITMKYIPSDSNAPEQEIVSDSVTDDGAFHVIDGVTEIGGTQSSDNAPAGYVDIDVIIPTNRDIELTSLQIVGVNGQTIVPYDEQPVEREKAFTFGFFRDSILLMPKDTILTGWLFGQNPWQFRDPALSTFATNGYATDQTIIVQQNFVDTGTQDNIKVGRASDAEHRGFEVEANKTNNQFAVIQYIDPSTMRPYWDNAMSSLVRARIFSPTHNSQIPFKMRLLYRTSLPPTIGQNEPINSWTAGDDPQFAAGWNVLEPETDPAYILENSYASGGSNLFPFYAFNNFRLPASSSSNMTLAVVMYTTANMDPASTADRIVFDKASLVPNRFAIDHNPITFDETLRQCQFYWEQSYPLNTPPGTSISQPQTSRDSAGALLRPQLVYVFDTGTQFDYIVHRQSFFIQYQSFKRSQPDITLYSPTTGASNRVRIFFMINGSVQAHQLLNTADWKELNRSRHDIQFEVKQFNDVFSTNAGKFDHVESFIIFQYVFDARMGR